MNTNFNAPVTNTTANVNTFDTLRFGTTYYWRVRAIVIIKTDTVISEWSDTSTFSIINNPTIISPQESDTIALAIPNIIVKWNKINGTIYECKVYKENGTDSIAVIDNIIRDSSTVDTLSTLIFGNIYHCRVRAIANSDSLAWVRIQNHYNNRHFDNYQSS